MRWAPSGIWLRTTRVERLFSAFPGCHRGEKKHTKPYTLEIVQRNKPNRAPFRSSKHSPTWQSCPRGMNSAKYTPNAGFLSWRCTATSRPRGTRTKKPSAKHETLTARHPPRCSCRLSELAMHRNVKIKDHAEAAIGNLNIRSSVSTSMRSASAVSDFGSVRNGDRRSSAVSEAPSSGGINLKNIIPGVDVESAIGNLFRH